MSLQVIKDAKSSEKADVYAFGILLWELATREQVSVVMLVEAGGNANYLTHAGVVESDISWHVVKRGTLQQ